MPNLDNSQGGGESLCFGGIIIKQVLYHFRFPDKKNHSRTRTILITGIPVNRRNNRYEYVRGNESPAAVVHRIDFLSGW